jgi:hypothetical protein
MPLFQQLLDDPGPEETAPASDENFHFDRIILLHNGGRILYFFGDW